MAIPRLPASKQIGQPWHDYLPISMATGGFQRMSYQFMGSLIASLASAKYQGQWLSNHQITGIITAPFDRRRIETLVTFEAPDQPVRISITS